LEKYKIKSINLSEAKKVWDTSPNACIYNNPSFLNNYKNIEFLAVLKGNEVMCCWPIISSKEKMIIPNFFYYFGPYWSKKITEQPRHSWLSTSSNVYSKFIEFFSKNFKEINFQFHYSLLDIRIFDWWNYGLKNKKKFEIVPKYSAIIDLSKKKDLKEIMSDYRYVRRYEIKNFIELNDKLENCNQDIEKMCNLYLGNNSEKYNRNEEKKLRDDIKILCKLADNGFGEIRCVKEKKTNELIYFNVVLFDKNSVHLALNSCEKKWKKLGIMAWGINDLLNNYVNKFDKFDFNGANSPLRGDDKHSYGAIEKLYFQLKY
jgi:hypothetical protein|tara:strand:- start:1278 stop:2228 length:951 start_codon:yes stop_codon:yes gene_type:complete